MFEILILLALVASCKLQFLDPQLPLQFAGFAAINVPITDIEDFSDTNNNYYPYSPFQHVAVRNQIEQLQQQQAAIQPLPISNALSSLPKRENENGKSVKSPEKEQQQEQLSRSSSTLEHANYLSLINDKDNFQASGCGWDLIRLQCYDLFGLCKGGCRDFAIALNSPVHDCRCIPYGYLALVKLAGK